MEIQKNIPLKNKNWFKTGGNAKFFCQPTSSKDFQAAIAFAKENNLETFILGQGANILISDDGFDGLVINPNNTKITIDAENEQITSGAGVDIKDLINKALDNNLIGLEDFSGIPANVGGACYMNIHYFNNFFSDFVVKSRILNLETNKIESVSESWFDFGYDVSRFQEKTHYLVNVTFQLKKGTPEEAAYAKGRRDEIIRQRDRRYPQKNTCGCFFRNFEKEEFKKDTSDKNLPYVAYYLDALGIKGKLAHENAYVSEKHVNMIITKEGATSDDVIQLSRKMQKLVFDAYGMLPQPECQLVGFKEYPLIK
jgi:UDP-N-acetylmuramate dehydrogenase